MKTKSYHAHEGGRDACIVPPGNGFSCPYATQEAAINASLSYPAIALEFAFATLRDLSFEQWGKGGDRPARIAIAYAHRRLSGMDTLVNQL